MSRKDEVDHEIASLLSQLEWLRGKYQKTADQWLAIEEAIHKVRETFMQELD